MITLENSIQSKELIAISDFLAADYYSYESENIIKLNNVKSYIIISICDWFVKKIRIACK